VRLRGNLSKSLPIHIDLHPPATRGAGAPHVDLVWGSCGEQRARCLRLPAFDRDALACHDLGGDLLPLAQDFNILAKKKIMWYNGNYPTSYQHQPVRLRQKALEIANSLLAAGVDENTASDIGLREAREFFRKQRNTYNRVDPNLPAFP
jgi:hypothetical protein